MGKWGNSDDVRTHPAINGWIIKTRRFNVDDGTFFYQVKFSKSEFSFRDPTASVYGWYSSPPRKKKEFNSHESAYHWAIGQLT